MVSWPTLWPLSKIHMWKLSETESKSNVDIRFILYVAYHWKYLQNLFSPVLAFSINCAGHGGLKVYSQKNHNNTWDKSVYSSIVKTQLIRKASYVDLGVACPFPWFKGTFDMCWFCVKARFYGSNLWFRLWVLKICGKVSLISGKLNNYLTP